MEPDGSMDSFRRYVQSLKLYSMEKCADVNMKTYSEEEFYILIKVPEEFTIPKCLSKNKNRGRYFWRITDIYQLLSNNSMTCPQI